jgi:hypothetical protein
MGWGSAYEIFNNVANSLIKSGASDEVKEEALTKVIASLQAEDWDTELDSLQSYLDDPAIVRAFANNDITWDDEDDERGDSDSAVLALISEIAGRLEDATDEGEYQAAGLIGDLANGRKTVEEAREELTEITFRHV